MGCNAILGIMVAISGIGVAIPGKRVAIPGKRVAKAGIGAGYRLQYRNIRVRELQKQE